MRPESHRHQIPEKRCGNCRFRHEVKFKRDDLCFHGEENLIEISGKDWDGEWITFIEDDLAEIDGDEYSRIWAARHVDLTDICDHWEQEEARDDPAE